VDFKPEPGVYNSGQLVVWNIEGAGPLQKFRALYQGENVAEVFNSAWAGKTMDQVVPISLRRVTLDAAKECASSGCLIYTIVSTIDANDHRVDRERLLVPFGSDGSKVEQILASLQLTSAPGRIQRTKILNNFEMQADLLLSGRSGRALANQIRCRQFGGHLRWLVVPAVLTKDKIDAAHEMVQLIEDAASGASTKRFDLMRQ
jgi:hypothetical protein